ncbi:MAG: hypothetical protein HYU64_18565, partial [Armatimonadetes bacterium]|nr:hypothetical protein [Armatimonadota bacterium]
FLGLRAASLKEFLACIKEVDVHSIKFHQSRGDFRAWLENELHEVELARGIGGLNPHMDGDELRKKIVGLLTETSKS